MVIDVNVLTAEPTDNSLDVTVSVNTSSRSLATDYSVRISDSATGGSRTLRGSLDGTGGGGPGDEVIHEVSFDLTSATSGTVTAEIVTPQQYAGAQDERDWQTASAGINVNECAAEPTSSGDLEVSYTLTPSLDAQGETFEVKIRVNNQQVGSASHEVPNTITRTQTIPADDLPTGSEMPVGIEVAGNFSECGTVTVGGAAEGSIVASDCSVSASGAGVIASVTLSGSSPTGEVVLTLLSDATGTGPFTTVETGTEFSGTEVEVSAEPEWTGDHTVSIEAAVIGSDGGVLDVDTVTCGEVTLDDQQGGGGAARPCEEIIADHGDAMRRFGTPGEVFGPDGFENATAAWRRDELDAAALQSLQTAVEQECVVPERAGGDLPLTEIAIGAGVVGAGYAASRFL